MCATEPAKAGRLAQIERWTLTRLLSSPEASCTAQGFDKYGVWRVDALAAPNLKAALKLKVSPI